MGKASKDIGDQGEEAACQYLNGIGYRIVLRNFRSQQGEVDIIAEDRGFLVFIEVKSYSFRSLGSPLGAVRKSKKESIIHAARTYLFKLQIRDRNCRFDVIAIYKRQDGRSYINHIKNAFYIK